MKPPRILTLHPKGLKGVNIVKVKYEQVKSAILEELAAGGEQEFGALMQAVEMRLSGEFEGSIGWYFTVVKLDLEARGVLVCSRESGSRQLIRLG